jgi:hypothetical protein
MGEINTLRPGNQRWVSATKYRNRPLFIVENKIVGFADITVARANGKTFQILHFTKHNVTSVAEN